MTTFYTGYRHVLRGRNANNFVNTYTGRVGKYSNWSLMDNGGQILTGAPDREYVLGANTNRQTRLLEYLFVGKPHNAPMRDPGTGTRLAGARFSPMTYRGLAGAAIFSPGYGHVDRVTSYSLYNNFIYDGLTQGEALKSPGHIRRFNSTWGGAFDPYINKGVRPQALATTTSNPFPTGYNNPYGKNRVKEWRGVPSAKAL